MIPSANVVNMFMCYAGGMYIGAQPQVIPSQNSQNGMIGNPGYPAVPNGMMQNQSRMTQQPNLMNAALQVTNFFLWRRELCLCEICLIFSHNTFISAVGGCSRMEVTPEIISTILYWF